MKIDKKVALNKNVGGNFFLKNQLKCVKCDSKSECWAEQVCLQHEQLFYQTFFNVRNQIFTNKLLDYQWFDTKTFNCKVVQGKNQ